MNLHANLSLYLDGTHTPLLSLPLRLPAPLRHFKRSYDSPRSDQFSPSSQFASSPATPDSHSRTCYNANASKKYQQFQHSAMPQPWQPPRLQVTVHAPWLSGFWLGGSYMAATC